MEITANETAAERYTSLHRAIDRGELTDTNWAGLAAVCVELGMKDEALQTFQNVVAPGLRRDVQRRLADKGWAAPVSRDATAIVTVTESDLSQSPREKFWDSVQFLADANVRMSLVAGTVAFPVALCLGGLMTSAIPFFGMRWFAALPALLVLGIVGAWGRQVLIHSLRATDDTSSLPKLRRMGDFAPRFLVDFVGLTLVFLTPGAVAAWLGVRWLGLLLLLPAAFLLPMAAILRFVRNDWRWLTPRILFGAVRRCPSYVAMARVVMPLFAPALLVFLFTVGKPLFLMISVVGPLALAPYLAAMRMLGLTLHYERHTIEDCLTPSSGPPAVPPAKAPTARAAQPQRARQRSATTKPASSATR